MKSDPEAVIDLIYKLFDEIEKLSDRVKQLEDQIAKNSGNSSRPPSTDGFKKIIKSSRKKTGLKPGGQKGRPGMFLKPINNPDNVIVHKVDTCSCGCNLEKQKKSHIKKQIFDIPEIKISVTEHIFEVADCPDCGQRVTDPLMNSYSQPAQYGQNIKSLCLYLMNYQLLPYERTTEFCRDIFGISISPGSLMNWNVECYDQLKSFEAETMKKLMICPVINADETGVNISGKLHWLHSYSSSAATLFFVHKNRGNKAMFDIGILPKYFGTVVHDYWRAYYNKVFNFGHALCNAHLLRELKFLSEEKSAKWAKNLIDLLIKIKAATEKAIEAGKDRLTARSISFFNSKYQKLIRCGMRQNPEQFKKTGKRGRKKRTIEQNLLLRLRTRPDEILHFMNNFIVPFDNNLAERDLRMTKAKLKISGCFRSQSGAQMFARIRSYISTSKKNSKNILVELKNSLDSLSTIQQNG